MMKEENSNYSWMEVSDGLSFIKDGLNAVRLLEENRASIEGTVTDDYDLQEAVNWILEHLHDDLQALRRDVDIAFSNSKKTESA